VFTKRASSSLTWSRGSAAVEGGDRRREQLEGR
jgi:hypothetical protein